MLLLSTLKERFCTSNFRVVRRAVKKTAAGFSLVEAILSGALLTLLVTGLAGAIIYGQQSVANSGQRARAVFLAEEGLEAARSIRDSGFANLVVGDHGLNVVNNQWAWSAAPDVTDIFSRTISVSQVDPDGFDITSRVTWSGLFGRPSAVTLVTRLTNWR